MASDRICIIGAGPSGITAAANLLQAGFDNLVILDRGHRVGGNWVFDAESGHSSVFETTHIISSRRFSQYEDFPFPEGTPDYPGHEALARYFQAYATRFGLEPHIRFRTLVTRCALQDDGRWAVTSRAADDVDDVEATEIFDRLVVANGHHWDPRWPAWAADFSGECLHAHDFKRAEPFRDRRVLVVGGGNSACDCAVETSRVSACTDISWRRGYWIVPKFIFGRPGDTIYNRLVERAPWVPLKVRYKAMGTLLRALNGPNRLYGLPEPDHAFGETHPTVNSELLYFLRHGAIRPRPDVAQVNGQEITFTDGTRETYDAVICCTGYRIAHPFFDRDFIDYSDGPVPLYRKMIHPRIDSLAFVGLFQPIGCIWPLAELQSKLLARWWSGQWAPPTDRAAAIQAELDRPHLRQVASPRHTITVDYPTFRRELLHDLGRA